MHNVYCVDSITIVRDAGRDQHGTPLAPTTENIKGYIEWKTQKVRDLAGEEVVSRGKIFLKYDGTIDHKDKIRISAVDYPILALEPAKDFSNIGLWVYIA